MNNTFFIPFTISDNILVYNGESLPEDIKDNVTRSIVNLMNSCRNIYDTKIYRSPHCIWYILVKNISDYFILQSLKNSCGFASNNNILKDALLSYPSILLNYNINYSGYQLNYLHNVSWYIGTSENLETNDNFDLLR